MLIYIVVVISLVIQGICGLFVQLYDLGINRLCSATFEQLLAFSATFCTASNGQ